MNKREFIFGFSKPLKQDNFNIVRPPYFDNDNDFALCAKCDKKDCVMSCQENIIKVDNRHGAVLDFHNGGCTYCDKCAEACKFGVLKKEYICTIDFDFSINKKCLSWNQIMCFSCKDPCIDNAIIFDNMFKPVIDISKCTSCGFCVSVCPANAIDIKRKNAS